MVYNKDDSDLNRSEVGFSALSSVIWVLAAALPQDPIYDANAEPDLVPYFSTSFHRKSFSLSDTIEEWFSTEVPRNPLVPWKALGVPPISEFNSYFLVNCKQGCRQIVILPKKGTANQKRLKNTEIEE